MSDPLSARITWVSSAGSLIRTERAPAVGILRAAGLSYLRPRQAGIEPDGAMILLADRHPVAGGSPFLTTMGFGGRAAVQIGRNTSPLRVLVETADAPACVVSDTKAAAVVPLCTGSMLAVRSDGSGVIAVQFDTPRLSPIRVHSLSARGDTVFSLAIPIQPAPLPSRLVDSVLRPLRENPVYRGQVVAPRYYPPIRRLIVGRDGSVWLEEHQPTDRHQWLVIFPQGKIVGRLTVPGNFRIITAEVGTIWGAEVDEDDVPTIVRYRVR